MDTKIDWGLLGGGENGEMPAKDTNFQLQGEQVLGI